MEPNLTPKANSSQARDRAGADRWFVRSQGSTIGPFSIHEIRSGLERQELSALDKICASGESTWRPLGEHPAFTSWIRSSKPRSAELVSPPSPRTLRIRKVLPPLPLAVSTIPELPKISEVFTETFETVTTVPTPDIVLVAAEPAPQAEEIPEELTLALDEAATALEEFVNEEEIWGLSSDPISAPALDLVLEPAKSAPEIAVAPLPTRPDYKPVFIADPVNWSHGTNSEASKKAKPSRTIQIELKLPERPWRILIVVLMIVAIAYVLGQKSGQRADNWEAENKTRDLKDSRLSDPSSPTTVPSEAGDPIPPLKAPTRPQRE